MAITNDGFNNRHVKQHDIAAALSVDKETGLISVNVDDITVFINPEDNLEATQTVLIGGDGIIITDVDLFTKLIEADFALDSQVSEIMTAV